MASPFTYAVPVEGDDFCDRRAEVEGVADALAAGRSVAVSGGPGSGTSSLAWRVGDRLRASGARVVRAELWEAEDDRSVARLLAAGLTRASAAGTGRDTPGGRPTGAGPGAGPAQVLGRLEEPSGRAALLLDDAGKLAGSECPETREALAALASGSCGIGLFGTGSARPGRPDGLLSDAGVTTVTHLGPIPLAAWLPYALERFLVTDTWVANEHVEEVVEAAGGHPRRTQELLHTLWELAQPGGEVEDGFPEAAIGRLLERRTPRYRTLWDSLTANQRRTLLGLAMEGRDARPYSSAFVQRYGLAAASSVQRALEALRDRGLVVEADAGGEASGAPERETGSASGDTPALSDPFFARWLRRRSARPAPPAAR